MDASWQGFVSEFKDQRGWRVVLASAIGYGCGINVLPFYTLGVFVEPLQHAFGWSRAEIQGSLVFVTVATLAVGWLVGWLCDRHGVRRVALVSQVGLACGLGLLALAQGGIVLWYAIWLAMSVAAMGTTPITWSRGITGWFDRGRGLALALGLMGGGIFGFLSPLIAAFLIETIGWRGTYLVLTAMVILIAFPLALLFFHERYDRRTVMASSVQLERGLSVRAAISGRHFWLIITSTFLAGFAIGGLIPNLVPLLTDRGITLTQAAGYASFIGLALIVGRLVAGFLLDRIWAPYVALGMVILPAISCFLFVSGLPLGPFLIGLSAIFIGLASGAEFDILAYICSRYFGIRHYGQLYAYQWISFSVAAGLAPSIFGHVHDISGSYNPILYLAGVFFVASPLFLLGLGRYPDFTTEAAGRA